MSKKEMKIDNKSRISSKVVAEGKVKLQSLQFIHWIHEFIKPSRVKNDFEAETITSNSEIRRRKGF